MNDLASAAHVRKARVPASWQAQFDDLRDYAGAAWYWRAFPAPILKPGQAALLRFGAVDYLAEVYVNGRKAGSHEGGYLPFEFDVAPLLRPGENKVAVRVADPGPKLPVQGIDYEEIPHGKQNWYVQTSGLWQGVELDLRPRFRLGAVHISAGADGSFRVDALLANSAAGGQVGMEVRDPAGKPVWRQQRQLKAAQQLVSFSGRLAPRLWNLEDPALYTLRVSLSSGDSETERFGFRTFESRGGKFFLNGRPVYLRGALDQDFYPDTIYTPPSLDYLRNEMRQAKGLGLNLLRCHIKVPDPRYLQAADEAGVLIWYEIPNWDRLTEKSKERAMATLRGMVERDWNHPSLVILSVMNESWGANLKEASHREWLKQAYREAKSIVPGWLVVDNSPCCSNFHLVTDVADFHEYKAIPDHAADFTRAVEQLASRSSRLFSPYGDAEPKGDEPLVLSEFGNWGLPRLPEPKPWWWSRDFRGNPITKPEGIEKRFAEHQYGSLFPDVQALAEATEWHQLRALQYEIETLRMEPEIQGYVITEFTDLNWEANGLLDMWRRPKVHAGRLARLQQDDLLVIRPEKRNWTAGERVRADVFLSHYSAASLDGAEIVWMVEGDSARGKFLLPPVPSGSAEKAGGIEFPAPAVSHPTKSALVARVTLAGKVISENSVDLFFYPSTASSSRPAVAFHDPSGRLSRLRIEMDRRNYGAGGPALLIASAWDRAVKLALEAGGRVLLLADERQELSPSLEIVPRNVSNLDGNWISSFHWIRKDSAPFRSIAFDTLAGWETEAVAPAAVVRGVPPEKFGDVLAGMFYGWIHSNVGTLVQARYGRGRLLICTFSLAGAYGKDPYATHLLDALVDYALSDFKPEFEIPAW